MAHHIMELTIKLNDNEGAGNSTWIRIRQAQVHNKCTKSILSLEKEQLNDMEVIHNMALHVIREAHALGFRFEVEHMEKCLEIAERGIEIQKVLRKDLEKGFRSRQNLQL